MTDEYIIKGMEDNYQDAKYDSKLILAAADRIHELADLCKTYDRMSKCFERYLWRVGLLPFDDDN